MREWKRRVFGGGGQIGVKESLNLPFKRKKFSPKFEKKTREKKQEGNGFDVKLFIYPPLYLLILLLFFLFVFGNVIDATLPPFFYYKNAYKLI